MRWKIITKFISCWRIRARFHPPTLWHCRLHKAPERGSLDRSPFPDSLMARQTAVTTAIGGGS